VPLSVLIVKGRWHALSFASFVGVYGYLNIRAPLPYYAVAAVFYTALGTAALLAVLRHAPRRKVPIVLLGGLFVAGTILQSLYNSWTYDNQPQGRYLFPVIPILLLTWLDVAPKVNPRWLVAIGTLAFVIGTYSFLAVGLAHFVR
jgi:uncharacterized membrane protein